jgi:hypothetical protein
VELEQEKEIHSAFELLKFLKYLKFENIEMVIIQDILGSEKTEKSVYALITLGIVKLNYNYPDCPSIQFDSLMKQELENYIEMTKMEQPIELLIDLIILSIPKLLKAKFKLRIYLFSFSKGEHKEALYNCITSLQIKEKVFEDNHPSTAKTYYDNHPSIAIQNIL